MTSSPSARGIRVVIDAFRDHGWKDEGNTALRIMEAVVSDDRVLDTSSTLAVAIPEKFLVVNDVSIVDVYEVVDQLAVSLRDLGRQEAGLKRPPILPMSEIDSFSKVRAVPPSDVTSFANPLNLAEDTVERIIAKVIGEPYLIKDWGGEVDDLYSGQVVLGGKKVRATFLLKGSGLKGPLKPKNLGKNGDQITRIMTQPAELFVVQHVGRVEPAVRKQLQDAVLARRFEGNVAAVGTVWDGVDTARLGVAYGFLDPSTGALIPGLLP